MGKYKNFADCTMQNKGKKDPEAYCASMMNKMEGEMKKKHKKMGKKKMPMKKM